MLRQEINLYQHIKVYKTSPSILTWKRFWFLQLFFLSVFSLVYFVNLWNIYQLELKENKLAFQAEELQKKFNSIKSQFPSLFFTQNVTQSIKTIQLELDAREKILETIENPIEFSRIMATLSLVAVPNVWLQQFFIENSGNEIILKGSSLSEEELQKFLDKILHEKTFAAYVVHIKNIESQEKEIANDKLNFEISVIKKNDE